MSTTATAASTNKLTARTGATSIHRRLHLHSGVSRLLPYLPAPGTPPGLQACRVMYHGLRRRRLRGGRRPKDFRHRSCRELRAVLTRRRGCGRRSGGAPSRRGWSGGASQRRAERRASWKCSASARCGAGRPPTSAGTEPCGRGHPHRSSRSLGKVRPSLRPRTPDSGRGPRPHRGAPAARRRQRRAAEFRSFPS